MKIKVLIHKAEEGGFWGEVPALPGCFSQGETTAELLANLREAIECHLDVDLSSETDVLEVQEVEV
jgi:predicted RNase H-like HicB family nuclease